MYETGKLVGIVSGVIFGLIICLIVFRAINSDKKIKTEYDERQRAIRDRGYFYGYWVLLTTIAIVSMVESMGFVIPADSIVKFFFEFFISGAFVCIYTIMKGAYFGINNVQKRFYIFMIVVAVLNFGAFIAAALTDGVIVDGMLCAQFANLLAGILFLIIACAIIIKNAMDKKEDEVANDEES